MSLNIDNQTKLREIFKDHCFYSDSVLFNAPFFKPVELSFFVKYNHFEENQKFQSLLQECKSLPTDEVYCFFEHELRMEAYLKFSAYKRKFNRYASSEATNEEKFSYLMNEKSYVIHLDNNVKKDLSWIKKWYNENVVQSSYS